MKDVKIENLKLRYKSPVQGGHSDGLEYQLNDFYLVDESGEEMNISTFINAITTGIDGLVHEIRCIKRKLGETK